MKVKSRPRARRTVTFRGQPLVVDEATSERLGGVRQRDTGAERLVRRILRDLGIGYGRSRARLPGTPDIVNLKSRWVIFVNGCFWHAHKGCPRATIPRRNRAFWLAKFAANAARDRCVVRGIRKLGFTAVVVWECEVEEKPALVRRRLAARLSPE